MSEHDGHIPSAAKRAKDRAANFIHPQAEITEPPDGITVDWDVPVPVRDGTILRVNVYRPADDQPEPAIMSAHPYGKDNIPANTRSGDGPSFQYRIFPQPDPIRMSAWTAWEAPDPAFWVPRGYVVVNADMRGAGTSEGQDSLLSDQEAQDYYDLIEWVGTQPWCDGKVGLDGVSYLALSQYKVAALKPPHLVAICPWEGFSDVYRDFARPGGVREDGFSIMWSKMTDHVARVDVDLRAEFVAHPERDEFYEALTPRLEDIEVPALICGSFSDHLLHTRGSFEAFRRISSPRKWLYTHRGGKWSSYYSEQAAAERARFFDHVLKGEDNGWDERPPVRLEIHEAGAKPVEVTYDEQWPPPDLEWSQLYLDAAAGTLVTDVPAASSTSFSTHHDKSVFVWTAPEDMDLIGTMALRLYIETVGIDDVNLFAGVRKVRDGQEVTFEGSYGFAFDMITKGWQRAAHRELDETLSTPWQPVHTHRTAEPLAPGEVLEVHMELRPQATRMRAGDQLHLDLRGYWFYHRDPVRGELPAGYQHSEKGTVVLHTGGDCDSRLLLGHRPVS